MKGEVAYKIDGFWNDKIYLIDGFTGEKELVFEKLENPPKCEFMYGYSHFSLQLNYLPSWLEKSVAPTDSRRRPDQRALENGDLKLATSEKNRLEEK